MCRLVQTRHIRVDGDECIEHDYELCEKARANGDVRCSSGGTMISYSNVREVRPLSPHLVKARPKPTVIHQDERPKPDSKDVITGVNMHLGWTPRFSLVKEKKRRPTYPPDGSMGLPARLPSQLLRPSLHESPLPAPDAPSPSTSLRKPTTLGTSGVASRASLSSPAYTNIIDDSGYEISAERYVLTRVALPSDAAPIASSFKSKALASATTSSLAPLNTNIVHGISYRPSSLRQSANTNHLNVSSSAQSHGTTATNSSRIANAGLRDNRASKDTIRSSFSDSALGTSVGSPSSPYSPSSPSVPTTSSGRRPKGPRQDGPSSNGVDYMTVYADPASRRETNRTKQERADTLSKLEGNSSSSRSRPRASLSSLSTTTRLPAISQESTTGQVATSFNRTHKYYIDSTTSEKSRHASGAGRDDGVHDSFPSSVSSPLSTPSEPSPRPRPLKPILRRRAHDNEAAQSMDDRTQTAHQTMRADAARRVAIEQAEHARAAAEEARLRDQGFGYR
ncbi:hypothetical protein BDV97DRAFT_373827 [Delphinella strobiligena]|nr:hypothetical protein BDV97DRAFT_373827 [Delphinella strobiligena]